MTPQEAYHKCKGEINKDLEPFIIKNPYYAICYAEKVIKGKLPENMHNMMLLHADQCAKSYFKFIENIIKPQP
jgi:hypothetical protein